MYRLLTTIVLILLLEGCSLDDEDRCPDGYTYHKGSSTCLDNDELYSDSQTQPSDTSNTDSQTDTGIDFGATCLMHDDCTGVTDFCAIRPGEQEGYCTVSDCTPGDCPQNYQCCDCTSSSILPAETICMNDDDAALAAGMAGCTCS